MAGLNTNYQYITACLLVINEERRCHINVQVMVRMPAVMKNNLSCFYDYALIIVLILEYTSVVNDPASIEEAITNYKNIS